MITTVKKLDTDRLHHKTVSKACFVSTEIDQYLPTEKPPSAEGKGWVRKTLKIDRAARKCMAGWRGEMKMVM